jgi:hypothetical protein
MEKKCTHDGGRGGSLRLRMCLLSRLDMQLDLQHSLLKISISENRASEMVSVARESGGDGEVSDFPLSPMPAPDELAPNQTKARTMPSCHPRLQRTTPSRSHPSRIYSACCSSIYCVPRASGPHLRCARCTTPHWCSVEHAFAVIPQL